MAVVAAEVVSPEEGPTLEIVVDTHPDTRPTASASRTFSNTYIYIPKTQHIFSLNQFF